MSDTTATSLTVQLISASWCKRCAVIKPEVESLCKAAGATFTVMDFDALDDDDPVKTAVTALPTIVMAGKMYTPAELDAWRTVITAAALTSIAGDEDF